MLTQSCMKILIVLSVLVALAPPAFGQAGRSEINGTVFDQEKAVLPGVTVTVTEENTGLTRNTVTTGDGTFLIPTLLPAPTPSRPSYRASSRRRRPASG